MSFFSLIHFFSACRHQKIEVSSAAQDVQGYPQSWDKTTDTPFCGNSSVYSLEHLTVTTDFEVKSFPVVSPHVRAEKSCQLTNLPLSSAIVF